METYRFSQDAPFYISSLADQIACGIAVVDVNDILGNDWPFVQLICDVMRCSSNQLDSPVKSLLIGIRAYERWKETVMNVDDFVGMCGDKERLQNLHVACQDQEIGLFPDKIEHTPLISLAGRVLDWKVVEGNIIPVYERFQVRMIAD